MLHIPCAWGNSRQFSSLLVVEVMVQLTSQVALAAIKFHLSAIACCVRHTLVIFMALALYVSCDWRAGSIADDNMSSQCTAIPV